MKIHTYSSDEVREIRRKLGMNQTEFWQYFHVTQSGGSRYESGRDLPEPVNLLMNIALGGDKTAAGLVEQLRKLRG